MYLHLSGWSLFRHRGVVLCTGTSTWSPPASVNSFEVRRSGHAVPRECSLRSLEIKIKWKFIASGRAAECGRPFPPEKERKKFTKSQWRRTGVFTRLIYLNVFNYAKTTLLWASGPTSVEISCLDSSLYSMIWCVFSTDTHHVSLALQQRWLNIVSNVSFSVWFSPRGLFQPYWSTTASQSVVWRWWCTFRWNKRVKHSADARCCSSLEIMFIHL